MEQRPVRSNRGSLSGLDYASDHDTIKDNEEVGLALAVEKAETQIAKRPRGRPRKHPLPPPGAPNDEPVVKRPRGRPKGSGKHQRAAAAAAAAVAAASGYTTSGSGYNGTVQTSSGLNGAMSKWHYDNSHAYQPNGLGLPGATAVVTPNLPASVSPPMFDTPSTRLRNRRKKATPTKAA